MKKKKLLKYWQKKLNLNDWIIELRTNCSPEQMCLENVSGEALFTFEHKTAVVNILDKQYYGERLKPYDFEQILIHELLHLKFASFEPDVETNEYKHMHQVLNELSEILSKTRK